MTILITIFTVLVAIGPGRPDVQWASIAIIFIFLATFGYAWQGCVWLYCAEIAPLEYRHIGAGATAFGEWLMTFITVFAGRKYLHTSTHKAGTEFSSHWLRSHRLVLLAVGDQR
jgi:hypothetical protein